MDWNELVYLQGLLGGGMAGSHSSWMLIAIFFVLALISVYKPERIRSPFLFRWACTFFVLALLLPNLAQIFLPTMGLNPQRGYGSGPPELMTTFAAISAIQPLFIALSLFCLFSGIAPRAANTRQPASAPAVHPLD